MSSFYDVISAKARIQIVSATLWIPDIGRSVRNDNNGGSPKRAEHGCTTTANWRSTIDLASWFWPWPTVSWRHCQAGARVNDAPGEANNRGPFHFRDQPVPVWAKEGMMAAETTAGIQRYRRERRKNGSSHWADVDGDPCRTFQRPGDRLAALTCRYRRRWSTNPYSCFFLSFYIVERFYKSSA